MLARSGASAVLAAIALLASPACAAEGITDIDKENGFLGIRFGTRIEDAPNLALKSQSKDGRYVCKVRKGPITELPGETSLEVEYIFFDGRCLGAKASSFSGDKAAVESWMTSRYGPKFDTLQTIQSPMGWSGARVSARVFGNSVAIYNRGWERAMRAWRLEDQERRWNLFPRGF
jgi:hypothetical protein